MGTCIRRIAALGTLIIACLAGPAQADIPAGSFDETWDGDGLSITTVGADASRGYAAVLQPDGKTVVAGWSRNILLEERFALVRYTTSGALDSTFDGDGRVETPIPGADDAKAFAMVRQPDGKLVVSGKARIGGVASWAVVRYNDNGTPDATFGGGDGIVSFPIGDADCHPSGYWATAAYGIALQGTKIVLAGCARQGLRSKFALTRLNGDGTPDDDTGADSDTADTPFGTGGTVFTDLAGVDNRYAYGMSLIIDGSVISVGGFVQAATDVPALARYDQDGALLSTTFVPTSTGARIVGMARQLDGKIVATGPAGTAFSTVRFESDGDVDSTFNGGNPRPTTFPQGTSWPGGVALQPDDGKILVAGRVNNGSNGGFGIVRYTTAGVEDKSFGSGGLAFLPTGAPNRVGIDQVAVLVQPDDDKIIVAHAGGTGDEGGGKFAAVRVIPETILTDEDVDGVLDRDDNCISAANTDQADNDGDGAGDVCDADDDNDNFGDGADNCARVSNPDQGNIDGDVEGNACDVDDDNDGAPDAVDKCPTVSNPDQRDADRDGLGAACDENDADGQPFNVSINGGDPFTNRPQVELTITVPDGATGVTVSNDGGFVGARTLPLVANRTYDFTLDTTRRDVTKVVYVRAVGPGVGNRTATDDIVLDQDRPVVNLAKRNRARTRLSISARDPNRGSGVQFMQVTTNKRRPGRERRFTKTVRVSPRTKTVFVRVKDKAGNFSGWKRERRGNR